MTNLMAEAETKSGHTAGPDGRDLSGETYLGFRVAAWRYRGHADEDFWPHRYAEHWSTPGAGAREVERLFTEDQLRAAITRAEAQ